MRRLGRARRLEFRWLLPGLALLAWWAFHEADSGLFQWGAARALAAAPAVRSVAPTPRAPRGSDSSLTAQRAATSRRVPPHGRRTLFGRVEIPRLGIRAMMTEGVDKQTLSRAIGHVPTTARPGEPGNCALAGHRDSFLRVQAKLGKETDTAIAEVIQNLMALFESVAGPIIVKQVFPKVLKAEQGRR